MIAAALIAYAASFPVTVQVDAGRGQGELTSIWRFFGADEPNYAHMKDGRKLLGALGALKPREVYFRTHYLLNTGDGTPALKWGSTNAYTEDAQGRPIYDWTVIDRIFDAYLERDVRPYVEIGFMPRALSTRPDPYQHEWRPGLPYGDVFTGWAYPPRDYSRWEDLVYQCACSIRRKCHVEHGPGFAQPDTGHGAGARQVGIRVGIEIGREHAAGMKPADRIECRRREHCIHVVRITTAAQTLFAVAPVARVLARFQCDEVITMRLTRERCRGCDQEAQITHELRAMTAARAAAMREKLRRASAARRRFQEIVSSDEGEHEVVVDHLVIEDRRIAPR